MKTVVWIVFYEGAAAYRRHECVHAVFATEELANECVARFGYKERAQYFVSEYEVKDRVHQKDGV